MKKKILEFTPFLAMTVASIITLAVYLAVMHGSEPVRIVQTCLAPLIPLVIPVVNRLMKIKIPFSLNVVLTLFAFTAMNFAAVLDFYGRIPHFDKFVHTAYGIVGSYCIFILLLIGKGERMKPWCFFVVIALSVLGIAALWEVFEYVGDAVAGSNMQGWKVDLDQVGDMTVSEFFKDYNAMWDTIWDIIVAAIGILIFYALIFIDKLCGYKVCKRVYAEVNAQAPSPSS